MSASMAGLDPDGATVLIEVDEETALQNPNAFDTDAEELLQQLLDAGVNLGVTVHGYDPEYYFEERADKTRRRRDY